MKLRGFSRSRRGRFQGAAGGRLGRPVGGVLAWLGYINLILLAFNMLPALPLALGLPATSRRRGRRRREVRYVPWQHIERVRVAPKAYGSRVELILGPNASLALRGFRHSPLRRAWRWILLVIPFWYLLRPTALTSPLNGPPRYQANVRGLSVDELRHMLRAVAPPDVAIAVLVRKR